MWGPLVCATLGHLTLGPVSPPSAGVCLAYFTSGFNTAAVDHEADGSTNNGIFQINSRKWCKNLNTEVPNVCQMYCSGRLGLSPRQPPWTNLCFYPCYYPWVGIPHHLLGLPRRVGWDKW